MEFPEIQFVPDASCPVAGWPKAMLDAALGNLVNWKFSLPSTGELELDDL